MQAAIARLPAAVREQGVTVQKRSSSILSLVALYSPDGQHDALSMNNYASRYVTDQLKRVPGVGDASVFGQTDYSMRVWLRPDKLAEYGLTPADVANALREQNIQPAVGAMGAEPNKSDVAFTYAVTTDGRFTEASQTIQKMVPVAA